MKTPRADRWQRIATTLKRRPFRVVGFGLLVAFALFVLAVLLRQPSHDRDWRKEIAVMPQIGQTGQMIEIDQLRDWTYSEDGPRSETYHPASYDLGDLHDVWLMVEPFGGSDAIAHTLVLFEFNDGRLLALTIEARKERGEIYSALEGTFNTYELVYLWAEARDVLTRRARYLGHDVFLYPLSLSPEDQQRFIGALIDKTNRLYERPRFYNTLFSNCTNELAKTADLDWSPAFILTGNAPEHLYRTGVIPGKKEGLAFEALVEAADMTELIKSAPDATASGFDAALLQVLEQRFAP